MSKLVGLGEETNFEYSENVGNSTLKKVNLFRLISNLICENLYKFEKRMTNSVILVLNGKLLKLCNLFIRMCFTLLNACCCVKV